MVIRLLFSTDLWWMANLQENVFSSTATFFKPYSYTLHISVSFVLLLMNVLAKQPVDCFSEDLKCWEAETLPAEVLRILRYYLHTQSQGHHTIDRLEERSMERGSSRQSSLKGRERVIINQTNTGTISKAMLGKLLRDGLECIWAFVSA